MPLPLVSHDLTYGPKWTHLSSAASHISPAVVQPGVGLALGAFVGAVHVTDVPRDREPEHSFSSHQLGHDMEAEPQQPEYVQPHVACTSPVDAEASTISL